MMHHNGSDETEAAGDSVETFEVSADDIRRRLEEVRRGQRAAMAIAAALIVAAAVIIYGFYKFVVRRDARTNRPAAASPSRR